MEKKILIINGPNLNLLGCRENNIYGDLTLQKIEALCKNKANSYNCEISFFQSNTEGEIVDAIHKAKASGITNLIINPAAYTHTSIAIMDAIKAVEIDTIEVHLSNIYQRETFRHKSYISYVAKAIISGLKEQGYLLAIDYICKN